jgi:predicted dehydrogenase
VSRRVGIGIAGFGWMGKAHSRSIRRIPGLFPERSFEPDLVICCDLDPSRAEEAVRSFGFRESATDWRRAVEHPDVELVVVCAPNMLHEEICTAAAAAGKHVFCEKPVGGTPEATARIEKAARENGVISGVGYNYRWAPLVRHTAELIGAGRLGRITNYRGRFFSMYGSDPQGLLTWRFLRDQGGFGVSLDLLGHSLDLALALVGPITRVVSTAETFIRERPLPKRDAGTHYERGAPGDPTGPVTNEDYCGALVVFEGGARGTLEACRSMVGPQSQLAFDAYGTKGAVSWNFEEMNELRLFLLDERIPRGYATLFSGDAYPYHGRFVPGEANAIGFEDLKVIEDYEFLSSVVAGRPHRPGFEEAVAVAGVQAAMVRSWASGRWEDVTTMRLD